MLQRPKFYEYSKEFRPSTNQFDGHGKLVFLLPGPRFSTSIKRSLDHSLSWSKTNDMQQPLWTLSNICLLWIDGQWDFISVTMRLNWRVTCTHFHVFACEKIVLLADQCARERKTGIIYSVALTSDYVQPHFIPDHNQNVHAETWYKIDFESLFGNKFN